jgi:hypothetical protein
MKNPRKNRPERRSYNLRISKEDDDIMRKLRNFYCVNIPVFIRKSINDLYNQLRNKNEKT